MKRADLDHLLRAAGEVTGHRRFVLVGSTAIFAWHEQVPHRLMVSREADLYATDVSEQEAEDISDLLGNIGHLSMFDDTHGYYVDGIGPRTAVLPSDWEDRSKVYFSKSTNGVVAIVPDPEDIAASKLYAGREKDLDWVGAAHTAGLVDLDKVAERIGKLPNLTDTRLTELLTLLEVVRRREGDPQRA
jgi:hypothetical protein